MKKFLSLLSLFCILSFLVVPVSTAENWYYAGTSNNGDHQTVYINNDTVIKNNQEADLELKFENADGSYVIRRVTFYRDSQNYKYNNEIVYNSDGKQVDFHNAQDASNSGIALSARLRPVSASDFSSKIYFLIW